MKTKAMCFTLLIFCLLATSCICGNMTAIKGNGEIVTTEIKVSEYNGIEVYGGGKLVFNYEQTDAPASLKVSVDQNVFDELEIKVSEGKLVIRKKNNRVSLRPTLFTITGNSRTLNEVSLHGGGNVNVISPLQTQKLEADIAGSGTIHVANLVATTVYSEIAGSGTFIMQGTAESGKFDIAGSGDVQAIGCQLTKALCNIAGSGNIEVAVSESLKVSIAGSGYVGYKGNPSIDKSVAGSGSIKKID